MDSPSGQRHESIKLADEVNQAHRHGLKANHVATKSLHPAQNEWKPQGHEAIAVSRLTRSSRPRDSRGPNDLLGTPLRPKFLFLSPFF